MLIAIDTGGTKVLIASFSTSGKAKNTVRFPTPVDADEYIASLTECIKDNFSDSPIDGIVVGVPGIIKKNIITWAGGNLPWKNLDIVKPLHAAFKCPIWVQNDANLAGLGEVRSLRNMPEACLYVTISTGIGTGIITDGNINEALDQSEGGHSLVEYDGKLQEWELFASGKAIYRTYGKFARDIKSKSVWRQIADKISRGFLPIIPILQPNLIIIGGSIGTYFDHYEVTLKKLLKERLPEHIPLPDIRQAAHPEEAVIYGCYYYGRDKLSS